MKPEVILLKQLHKVHPIWSKLHDCMAKGQIEIVLDAMHIYAKQEAKSAYESGWIDGQFGGNKQENIDYYIKENFDEK